MKPSVDILTGKTQKHLVALQDSAHWLHVDVASAFSELSRAAATDGFTLKIASAFRDYSTQLNIWNEKAMGKRPLLDAFGNPLDPKTMSASEVMFAILRWSALPGASRHHWGTEIDLFASNLVPQGYQVQLVPSEAAPGGIFADFNRWLDDHMPSKGFFRPYGQDRGGISPEWWHLSYAPLSQKYSLAYTLDILESVVREAEISLKDLILKNISFIYERYIQNITPP